MMNEPKALQEIHRIREEIYEETKHMTPAEHTRYVKEGARKLIEEYNLKLQYEKKK